VFTKTLRAPLPLLTQTAVTMSSSIMGELVTETFDYDGDRQVTAYVPASPPDAVVFGGDGQLITQWGGVLEAADVPPTMIVGTHRLDDETLRLHEYSPVFDAERFAAHEKFFVEDVRQWARSCLGVALPPSARRCLASPRAESSRSPWGFAIPTSTVRSSARRREPVTVRLP
jgi:hypothetical protein